MEAQTEAIEARERKRIVLRRVRRVARRLTDEAIDEILTGGDHKPADTTR